MSFTREDDGDPDVVPDGRALALPPRAAVVVEDVPRGLPLDELLAADERGLALAAEVALVPRGLDDVVHGLGGAAGGGQVVEEAAAPLLAALPRAARLEDVQAVFLEWDWDEIVRSDENTVVLFLQWFGTSLILFYRKMLLN